MSPRVWAAFVLVLCFEAAAAKQGEGRVSVSAGWQRTSHARFLQSSAAAGHPGIGRPWGGAGLSAVFGYLATDHLELSLEPFAAGEQLHLAGTVPLRAIRYGIWLGLRFVVDLGGPVFATGGLVAGPTLLYAASGTRVPTQEAFLQTFGGAVGALYRLSETVGLNIEYKFTMGPDVSTPLGPIDPGGHWLQAGFTLYFADGEGGL